MISVSAEELSSYSQPNKQHLKPDDVKNRETETEKKSEVRRPPTLNTLETLESSTRLMSKGENEHPGILEIPTKYFLRGPDHLQGPR